MSASRPHPAQHALHNDSTLYHQHNASQATIETQLMASANPSSDAALNPRFSLPKTRSLRRIRPSTDTPSLLLSADKHIQPQRRIRCLRCLADDKGKRCCDGKNLCDRCRQYAHESASFTAERPNLCFGDCILFDWQKWLQLIRSGGLSPPGQQLPSSSPSVPTCLEEAPHHPIYFELSVQDRVLEERATESMIHNEGTVSDNPEVIGAMHTSVEPDTSWPMNSHCLRLCLCHHAESTSWRAPRVEMTVLDGFVKNQVWGHLFNNADREPPETDEDELLNVSKLLTGYISLIKSLPTTFIPRLTSRYWVQETIVAQELVYSYFFRGQNLLMTFAELCNSMVQFQHERPLTMTFFNALEIAYRGLKQLTEKPWQLPDRMRQHPICMSYEAMLQNAVHVLNQIALFDCPLRRKSSPQRIRIPTPVSHMRDLDMERGARFPEHICITIQSTTIQSTEDMPWTALDRNLTPEMRDPVISIFDVLELTSASPTAGGSYEFNIPSPTAFCNRENREYSIEAIFRDGLRGQEDMAIDSKCEFGLDHIETWSLVADVGDMSDDVDDDEDDTGRDDDANTDDDRDHDNENDNDSMTVEKD